MERTESQKSRIWAHLQTSSITPLEALKKYGCFRLGARIADLRNEGKAIRTDMVEIDGKRFASYSIENTKKNEQK